MCISGCHIIFWGDKTIKFGVNVIQRHSSKRQRYEPSSEKTWSTLRWLQRYDELRQSIEMMCRYESVSLLPWVVCVSGISNCFDDGSSTFSRRVFCSGGTCWWNILTLSYEQQRCHSSITSDWWTSYICEFSVTGWTASSRHWYGLRSEVLLLQRLLMEHFSSSVHHLLRLLPDRRTFIISSFISTKTSASRLQLKLWIVFDNISSQLW